MSFSAEYLRLERNLNLSLEADRVLLFTKLENQIDLPFSQEEIQTSIKVISRHLDREWLVIYTLGMVTLKTTPNNSHGLDFLKEVIPVGLALGKLSGMPNFYQLVRRLNTESFERLSTILEVKSAAKCVSLGHHVELHPKADNGKHSDFRVNVNNKWIYFECKMENPYESDYHKRTSKYVSDLATHATEAVKKYADSTHRVDIILKSKQYGKPLEKLIQDIVSTYESKEYDVWKGNESARFSISSRKNAPQPESGVANYMVLSIDQPGVPKQAIPENAEIHITYDPYGSKELQKIRRLMKEAKEQLPRASKGVIILSVSHPAKIALVAQEKLRNQRYSHIACILVVGRETWLVPNPQHPDFPFDFAAKTVT